MQHTAWNSTCFNVQLTTAVLPSSRVGCLPERLLRGEPLEKARCCHLLKADFGCRCSSHWCAELVPSTGTTSWSSGCAVLLGLLPPQARAGRYIISYFLAVGFCTYVASYVLEFWVLPGLLPAGDRAALCLDVFFELYDLDFFAVNHYDLVRYDLVLFDLVLYDLDFFAVNHYDLVLFDLVLYALDFVFLELCLWQLCLRQPQARLALTPCATPTSQPLMGRSPSTESTDGESSSTWGR